MVASGRAAAHGGQEARPRQRPRPATASPGDPSTKDLHRGIGDDHLHCVVGDHSGAAYVELHPCEDAGTNACTLERALRFFAELGLDPPEVVRTDNAMVCRNSRRFQQLLTQTGARHIRTSPYTPRWNGKVERFIQTLQNEWAYSRTWSEFKRARPLPPKWSWRSPYRIELSVEERDVLESLTRFLYVAVLAGGARADGVAGGRGAAQRPDRGAAEMPP